jgi:hypothetical protein
VEALDLALHLLKALAKGLDLVFQGAQKLAKGVQGCELGPRSHGRARGPAEAIGDGLQRRALLSGFSMSFTRGKDIDQTAKGESSDVRTW